MNKLLKFKDKTSRQKGFTLFEILVVIAVLSIIGTIVLVIFSRVLKGNNKSQILSSIKQNGQAVLENMDHSIRDGGHLACLSSSKVIVVEKEGLYTRYKIILERKANDPINECMTTPADTTKPSNGCIVSDNPVFDVSVLKPADFLNKVCNVDDPVNGTILTDTNPQSGVSVVSVPTAGSNSFTVNKSDGFADVVSVSFTLGPGVSAGNSVSSQINNITFNTTIQLRN